MRGLSLNFVRTVAVVLTTATALALCLVSPSFAQRDPFDLAQAGFLAKDRGEFTLAVRLFDEALQRGFFADKQRGLLLYSRGASFERSEVATAHYRTSMRPLRCFRTFPTSMSIEGSSGVTSVNTSARFRTF